MPTPKLVIVEIIVNSFRKDVHIELYHKIMRTNGYYGRVYRKITIYQQRKYEGKNHSL